MNQEMKKVEGEREKTYMHEFKKAEHKCEHDNFQYIYVYTLKVVMYGRDILVYDAYFV